jgi:hypothetical protein
MSRPADRGGNATRHRQCRAGGFTFHTLRHRDVAVTLVAEAGGRIVSLRDRRSGREWLDGWQARAGRRLWLPEDPADFASGPGAGLDECLPTVLACRLGDIALPDHGEIWNQPARIDAAAASAGWLVCDWTLSCLPMAFRRSISLLPDGVLFRYRLRNLSPRPQAYLWAWHPLFRWQPGDEIRFAKSLRHCHAPAGDIPAPWPCQGPGLDLARALFPAGAVPAAKVFLGPLGRGRAEIRGGDGASLRLSWPVRHLPYAGIWITRGFWKGLHHWAIEPTNHPADHPASPAAAGPARLEAGETRHWQIRVRFASALDDGCGMQNHAPGA